MSTKKKFNPQRRQALREFATAPAVAAAAVVAAPGAAAAEEPKAEAPTKKGYHVTDHVRAYYRTAAL